MLRKQAKETNQPNYADQTKNKKGTKQLVLCLFNINIYIL